MLAELSLAKMMMSARLKMQIPCVPRGKKCHCNLKIQGDFLLHITVKSKCQRITELSFPCI